ncbi:MAG TPA: universal stress protein [Acidisarcina sp.]|nr:universal stress protein [Acidisarcina sp.]
MLEPGSHRWSKPASILVATDLGDVDRLFPFALQQAKQSGARLFLLHVLTATNSIAVDPGGLPYYSPSEAIHYAEKFLASYCAEARQANIDCEVLVREGTPTQQILAAVRQLHIDRVLLGTRSRSKWGKLLLGSVAEQVLRSVSVPVFTVGPEAHQGEAAVDGQETILHATSLSKASRASAALACEVARASRSQLILLHVLTPGGSNHDLAPGAEGYATEGWAKDQLVSLIPSDLACQCACSTRVVTGHIAIEILAHASAVHASLIVLGAVHSSAMGAIAREGTVYRVLAHARCPVLTLREPDQVEETSLNQQGFVLHE